MPANVEIKATLADVPATALKVARIATTGPHALTQDDTFFACAQGRLKLREFGPSDGQLIAYRRPDRQGPKLSEYSIVPTTAPAALREALSHALGVIGRVRKHRTLYLVGRTRVHLDAVDGLGDFLELEVVLEPGEPVQVGEREARALLAALDIPTSALVPVAYIDLLAGVVR
jgi:adenylate cyclase class IV